jgi:formate dehydrogenase major subunit
MAPALKADRAGALVSELSTDEELTVISSFFRDTLEMKKMDGFYGNMLRGFVRGLKPFADQGVRPFTGAHNILASDAIVVVEANPQEEAPVAASYIRVSTVIERAKLINVSSGKNPFDGISDQDLRTTEKNMLSLLTALRKAVEGDEDGAAPEVKEIASILRNAKKPVVVIGSKLAEENPLLVTEAVNLAVASKAFFEDGLGVVPMLRAGNSLGALNTITGESDWVSDGHLDFLYVLSTGMVAEDKRSLEAMTRARFVVVHPLVNMADVLLPAPAWFERSGHYCTLEGERRRMNLVTAPTGNIKGLSVIMKELAGRLGVEMQKASAAPCENVYEAKAASETARTVHSAPGASVPFVKEVR